MKIPYELLLISGKPQKRNMNPFDFGGYRRSLIYRTAMLCDVCGVREATIHKTATNSNVSTVESKIMPVRHYCTGCFEKTFSRVEQPEESEQEPERQTPNTPAF